MLRWTGAAVLGAITALLVNLASGAALVWVTHGDCRLIYGPYWIYSTDVVRVVLLTLLPLLAHVVTEITAGGLAASSPGKSGALSAVLGAIVASIRLLVSVLSIALNPDPNAIPFSEHAGFTFTLAGSFAISFPFTVLAGYLGGRLDGRLRQISGA